MRRRLSVWVTLLWTALLGGQAACGAPDLIVSAAGLPTDTRWLDVILWQVTGGTLKQQAVDSRQLIDAASRDEANFYRIGLLNLSRESTYAIFVAAFKDDGQGVPCLLNTAQAIQDPGWGLVGDILVPFFDEESLPKTSCFQPQNATLDWPTQTPFIASVSLATTTFAGQTPDIPSLSIRGWNFLGGDTTIVQFAMPPTPTPTVTSKLLGPMAIDWSIEQMTSDRLTVQDITVERADKSARHTIPLNIELPKLQR